MTKQYIFTQDAEALAAALLEKASKLNQFWKSNGLFAKARRAYLNYYNMYYRGTDGTRTVNVGEQGEFIAFSVNHLRNLVQHTMALLLQSRLAFDVQALSTDLNARNACIIGEELLEQSFSEQDVDQAIRRCVELGLVMGTSFMSVEWNAWDRLVGVDSSDRPIYTGTPTVNTFTMFDIVMEPFFDDWHKHQYICVREIKNRWEMSAIYPEKAKELEAQPVISDLQWYDPIYTKDEDHIFVFRAWHKESPALPGGRYTVFAADGTVLEDGPNPYVDPKHHTPGGGIPVFCFRPSIKIASSYGHSIIFELMPIQECLNTLDSAIMTNQNNFAVQNIAIPRQSGISQTDISGGSRILEYEVIEGVPGGGKPEALQLCATPAEVFNYRKMLANELETISGINSVLRGQPQASLLSGAALAVVATQANVFNSNLEASYISMVEGMARFYLYLLYRFQATSDMVSLLGPGKAAEVREFKGQDLEPIRKIRATIGNPLSKTTAGKIELAEKLLQSNQITAPEYIDVIRTGNLDRPLDFETAQKTYMLSENESLLRGQQPTIAALDNHPDHMKTHQILLFNPDVRNDPVIRQNVENHLMQHADQFEAMATGNPTLLALAIGAPIPMPVPSPASGVGPGAQPAPNPGMGQPPMPPPPPAGAPHIGKPPMSKPSKAGNAQPNDLTQAGTMTDKALEAIHGAEQRMVNADISIGGGR